MAYPTVSTANEPRVQMPQPRAAISWAAVFAGTVIASALSITLITGGIGLGFLAMSPNETGAASAMQLGMAAVIWLFIVQVVAYGVAGYVTGRLRPMWAPAYSDEVYFRDTAHGLAVWALSALVSLALFGSAVSSVMGMPASGTAATEQGTALAAAAGDAAAMLALWAFAALLVGAFVASLMAMVGGRAARDPD